ncbi:MAG: DUF945 family protein [Sulfurimonas sp.]
MKKFLLAVVVVIVALAALPILGNKYVDSTLDERLALLKANGLGVVTSTEESSYLTTSKHYEFVLDDSTKFIEFLNQYATGQIPPYVDAVLNGAVVGVDIEYTNIPYLSTVALDIYPLSFSEKIMASIKKEDQDFYQQLKNFFTLRGLHYHMDYHLSSQQFNGYIKDVDQTFTLKDKTALSVRLQGTRFSGIGDLIAPRGSNLILKQLNLNLKNKTDKFIFAVEGLQAKSAFDSKVDYTSMIDVKNFKFIVDEKYNDLYFNADNFDAQFSSKDQDDKMDLKGATAIEQLVIKSSEIDLQMKKIKYDIGINRVDKDLLMQLQSLLSQQNINPNRKRGKEIEQTAVALLAKGLHVSLKELSVDDIVYDKNKDYKGAAFNAELDLKEDADLANKLKRMPMEALANLDVNTTLVLSKELFAEVEKNGAGLSKYAKTEGDKVIFDTTYKNSVFSVNGKTIQ